MAKWSSSGSTVTVPLTTAAITSSDLIKANRISTANIKIECNNDGTFNGRSSEINNYNAHLYLQHNSATNLVCCGGGGKVGIGVNTPTENCMLPVMYQLQVKYLQQVGSSKNLMLV